MSGGAPHPGRRHRRLLAALAWLPGVVVAGTPAAAALSATLLLLGFTFWLPMVPGLVLLRRAERPDGRSGRGGARAPSGGALDNHPYGGRPVEPPEVP